MLKEGVDNSIRRNVAKGEDDCWNWEEVGGRKTLKAT
jgi:hypothetical protein